MQKSRKQDNTKDLLAKVHDQFSWIGSATMVASSLPTAEQYDLAVTNQIEQYDVRAITVENFIKSLLEVDKGRASVIFCWKHAGLTLFVFKMA